MTGQFFLEWGAFEDAVAATVAAVKARRKTPAAVVFFRGQGAGAGYTPAWYPWFCISFDLVVAGGVLTAGIDTGRRIVA